MTISTRGLGMDACDVRKMTEFWSQATGCKIGEHEYPYYAVLAPDGAGMQRTIVVRVPEEKAAKNRLHMEFNVDDLDSESERLVVLGATLVARQGFGDTHWYVLQDPEGNEFCLLLNDD